MNNTPLASSLLRESHDGSAVDGAEASFEALVARRGNPPFSEIIRPVPESGPMPSYSPTNEPQGFVRLGAGATPDLRRDDRRLSTGSAYSTRASQFEDGALLGPRRPRPHKIWKKKYIKLLVVGDSGLGKTTLIKSLMSTPGERLQQAHDGSFTASEKFYKDPESLCSTISWRDEDDRIIWVYKIQDTPGYGDDLDTMSSISRMTKYIEQQNEKWLEMEQSKQRKEDLMEVDDPRIDLCLFCIPPHRLRPIDIKYMYELGRHVPVVPIVTKADTMTIREAATYRTEVANKLQNPMMPGIGDKINIFRFERDTMERAGIHDMGTPIPPFLVIASNEVNEELTCAEPPVYWPERRYPWGTAEAFNRAHSDMLSLRALLLKEALEEISKSKRQRYESWRRRALGGLKLGHKVARALMWTIVPAVVALQIGRTNLSVEDMRKNVTSTVRRVKDKVLKKKTETVAAPPPSARSAFAPSPPPPPPPPPPAPKTAPEPEKKKGWGF